MKLEFCASCGAQLGATPPCTCAACGAQFWDNPKPCGGAFIVADGRLLLVQRRHQPWAGLWDVPGGFCDGDEHPEAATLREVREETTLDIRLTGLLGMWIDRYDEGDNPATLNIYYNAVALHPDTATPVDEVTAVHWFSPEELADVQLAFPGHMRAAVNQWLASR